MPSDRTKVTEPSTGLGILGRDRRGRTFPHARQRQHVPRDVRAPGPPARHCRLRRPIPRALGQRAGPSSGARSSSASRVGRPPEMASRSASPRSDPTSGVRVHRPLVARESGRGSIGYWVVGPRPEPGYRRAALRGQFALSGSPCRGCTSSWSHGAMEPWRRPTAEAAGFHRQATLRGWERRQGAARCRLRRPPARQPVAVRVATVSDGRLPNSPSICPPQSRAPWKLKKCSHRDRPAAFRFAVASGNGSKGTGLRRAG